MKVPLSWLKEYIDIDLPPAQIAKVLTFAGLEVEGIESTPLSFENVVVGKVLETEKHPDADNLTLAKVTDGEQTYDVVCGAPNCRSGMKTAFARIGAKFVEPDGKTFKVKKSKIRGVESSGMLCSGKELGISEEQEGIIEFEEHLSEGADVAEMYADTIFDLSLTPNLNYCANVIGVARELSAATGKPIHVPSVAVAENADVATSSQITVAVEDKEACPRYACRFVKGVKVGPSPDWLKKLLEASGVRPVNNVVDITNFVLLEMGQPLHAFDYNLLDGQQIIVRSAKEGEHFVTLDGKSHNLTADNLLICDKSKPVAIGGVMGGLNSEVGDETTDVLLEAAHFHPSSIRRTSKQLGIQSESSRRFERGADPNQVIRALDRAAMMIEQLAGGEVTSGVVDIKAKEFPEAKVICRLSRVNHVLGTQLGMSEVEMTFDRLELPYTWDEKDTFTITVPTYRNDIGSEIDLIEEVARVYGYDKIGKKQPTYHASTLPHAPIYLFEREVRGRLISEGLQELLTCDLIGPSIAEVTYGSAPPDMVRVLNPTSIEQSLLRTSLLPGFLQMIKYNFDHQSHDISGFEVGRVHFQEGEQYKEQSVVGIVLTGQQRPHHWGRKPQPVDFFDLKGIIENILREMHLPKASFVNKELPTFHTGRQASIFIGDHAIGSLGEIHPAILRRLDVTQRIFFAELDLHELFRLRPTEAKMEEIPVYPSSERDWTLTLDEKTPVQQVFDAIENVSSRLLESVSLRDDYRSEKLGAGKKNVTFRFVYRDRKKTVAQEAVEAEHARLIEKVEKHLNV